MPTTPNKKRRRRFIAPVIFAAVLGVVGVGYALTALNINVPLLPAVGDQELNACDEDGVTTSFTYGNSSNNGVKVTAVNVAGISSDCATGEVYFLDAGDPVANYSGTVTSNAMNVSTNVWTFDFETVRVVLFP